MPVRHSARIPPDRISTTRSNISNFPADPIRLRPPPPERNSPQPTAAMNFFRSSKSEGAGRNGAEKNSQLIRAAKDGDASKVLALISGGADVRAKDNYGYTPLHWAGANGDAAAVEALLANGADVRAKNNVGNTRRILFVPTATSIPCRLLYFERCPCLGLHRPGLPL